MACLWHNQNETSIHIPSTEQFSNITYYVIVITVGETTWKVRHRYNDFYNLHNKLVADHGVSKDILPSKKVIGNKTNQFIETRRKALEEYLQKILVFLKWTMPKTFVEFLDFHLYDIYFLLQELSAKCEAEADFILSSTKTYTLTPLEVSWFLLIYLVILVGDWCQFQLYAVSEFLKLPFSEIQNLENRLDIGPVLEMCSQLNSLTIAGSWSEYQQSNIIFNKLPFEFTSFKVVVHNFCCFNSRDMIF